jgi:hypothetical protein
MKTYEALPANSTRDSVEAIYAAQRLASAAFVDRVVATLDRVVVDIERLADKLPETAR